MSFANEVSKTFANFDNATTGTLDVSGSSTFSSGVVMNSNGENIFIQAPGAVATIGGAIMEQDSALVLVDDDIKVAFVNASNYVILGDVGNVNNGTGIAIDSPADEIALSTGALRLTGATLESNASGAANGKFLVITLNNVQYKIALNAMS